MGADAGLHLPDRKFPAIHDVDELKVSDRRLSRREAECDQQGY